MTKSNQTRAKILSKAFDLIYRNGYQSSSIDEIIAETGLTKGAFYYHFRNKDEMGAAVINEVVFPEIHQGLIQPLKGSDKPVKDIYKMIKNVLYDVPFFIPAQGCPLGNLIQEMGSNHPDFNVQLSKIVDKCVEALTECFRNGRKSGRIQAGISESDLGQFVLAGYWGVRNIGKVQVPEITYANYLAELKRYLKSIQ